MLEGSLLPCAVVSLELAQPLTGLNCGTAASGLPYDSARILVLLHGDPIADIEVPLKDGRIGAEELAGRILETSKVRAERHARSHGCRLPDPPDTQTLLRGLGQDITGRSKFPDHVATPFVSIIVPTVGRPTHLRRCLTSLGAVSYEPYEVVVVDNGPPGSDTRRIVQELRQDQLSIRYEREPRRGASLARNRGLQTSTAPLIAFVDDDVEVDREWLTRIVSTLLADSGVGAVTGLVMPASLDTPEERWFELFCGFGRGLEPGVFSLDRPGRGLLFPYWGAAFGSGNNMAFRRHVLERIGGFDPALGPATPARGGEDIDVFTRVILGGSTLIYEPRAICWHHHRVSADAIRGQTVTYAVSATAVLTKWTLRGPRHTLRILRLAVAVLLASFSQGPVTQAPPGELATFRRQLAMKRGRGELLEFIASFFLGPFLYVVSSARARRLGLREAVYRKGMLSCAGD